MATFIIFFGGTTALLMALRLLVSSFKMRDFLIFTFFVCFAVVLYYYAAMTSRILLLFPQFFAIDFPASTLMVAAFYLYMTVLLNPKKKFDYRRLIHLAPGLAALAVASPVFMAGEHVKFEMAKNLYSQFNNQSPDYAMAALPIVSAVAYIVLTLVELYKAKFKQKEASVDFVFILLMVSGFITIATIVGLAVFFLSILLLKVACILASALLLTWFLVAQMKPEILQNVVHKLNEKKGNRSYLKGQNINELKKRLIRLMNQERVYCSPDINVKEMAKLMNISGHQMSELLNKHFQKRFNQYVNEFRIAEAKQLLVQDKDTSVFSIGYQVGFNTPSMFNSVFRDVAGVTPKQFRMKAAA